MRQLLQTTLCLLTLMLSACSDGSSNRTVYSLDGNASGMVETINNIANMTVVSTDTNDLKAEYRAGFVQGKLQGATIRSSPMATSNCSTYGHPNCST
jgi:hypothetical protein